MVGAGKVFSLFSSPLCLLHPRRPSAGLLLLLSSFRLRRNSRSAAPLRQLSSVRTSNRTVSDELSFQSKSLNSTEPFVWDEWSQLVEFVSDKGYFDRAGFSVSELRENEDLSEEFLRVSEALVLFSKENPELIRSLPKKEIAVLVENVSPHLFKNGESSTLRLRNFLNGSIDNAIQAEVAETVDVIQYILSYACDNKNEISNEIIDQSVKNLLSHFVNLIKPNQIESPVRNISMKRGDWICIKCKLKNFARNNKCFECNELRPKRNLTGEEWDCPQCDFFNHGRNTSCLRCDFKKPAEITKKPSILEEILNKSTILDNGLKPDKDPSVTQTLDRILNPSNAQQTSNNDNKYNNNNNNNNNNKLNNEINWESLASQGGETGHVPFNPLPAKLFRKNNDNNKNNNNTINSTDLDARSDEMMPVRKGENRFVVSKKKDRSLTSPPYKKRIALEQANNENSYSGFVPFKPFPPDYFSKKRENKTSETEKTEESNNIKGVEVISPQENSSDSKNSYSDERSQSKKNEQGSYSQNSYTTNRAEESYNENSYSSESNEGSYSKNNYSDKREEVSYSQNNYSAGIRESEPLDMSEEAKAERWFKRAAQIKDIAELASIPDEDFPQIMPMRKGVNRFVVSKRKTPLERRLTNNQLRKNGGELSFGGEKSDESLSGS